MVALRRLAERTGETAYVSGWMHDDVIVLSTVEGSQAVRVAGLHRGSQGGAHARASGKLLLSYASPEVVENYLKAEIDALAFSLAPKNKTTVIRTIMKRLKTTAANAEEGYQDLLNGVDRKPFPSLDGLRNVQRMLKPRNPKIGEVKVEEVIDGRIMRKLDESGFIDRAYAAQGISSK